jgi:hypothetical protein
LRPAEFKAADAAQAAQEFADAMFTQLNAVSRYDIDGLRAGADIDGRLAALEEIAIALVSRVAERVSNIRGQRFAAAFGARLAATARRAGVNNKRARR